MAEGGVCYGLEMPSSGPTGGPCICRTEPEQGKSVVVSSNLWLLGIVVIGARSIAQEIYRCADGCKELVNHSREGQVKLQQRVAMKRCAATAASTVPVVVRLS